MIEPENKRRMEKLREIVDTEQPCRLDRYLAENRGLLSRSQLKLRLLNVQVNGLPVKLSKIVKTGDVFELELSEPSGTEILPEKLPLEIVYQDRKVIVVNKAQGMVSHPAHGNWQGTLANGLLWLAANEAGNAEAEKMRAPLRAGIVHRLDKDTSGILIAARDAETQEYLSQQFRERRTEKVYLGIVKGVPPLKSGRLDSYLARDTKHRKRFTVGEAGKGKRAVTLWECIGSNKPSRCGGQAYSLLRLRPVTGRTHQLRVHCKEMGFPLLGDPVYGKKDSCFPDASLMLHALSLTIKIPEKAEPACFQAALPEHFIAVLRELDLARLFNA